jgi:DNA-binding transcriptional LysR family regulator
MTYRALEKREVDFVIARIFEPIASEKMDSEVLYDEQEVIVAGANNPWTRRRKIELAELIHEPWTLPPPDSLSGSVIAQAFRNRGLDLPPTTIITSTVPVRIALLSTGRFLTIVPNSVLRFSPNNPVVKRLHVDLPTTRRPVGIVTLKGRSLSPVAQLFIERAREVAKPLAVLAKKLGAG